jgi:GT2 family glycosyltransferase
VEHTILSETVAVIIVNYNGGELLQRCLLALSKQTREPDRVLLVDNNSDDFSSDQIKTDFPQVEVLSLSENTGFAVANNLAVEKLEDVEWVALLNPDAYAEPDWLEKLLAGAKQYPDFFFFGCRMLAMKENQLDGTGDVYHVSGANWRRDHGKSADRRRQSDEILSPSGAAALFRRDIFLEAGGFNEDFFCYMEDVDLGLRLQLLGYRCFYIADAIVTHEGSGVVGKYSDFQVYYGHRNQVWVYLMNMPSPWVWIYLPQHLLYNVASIVLFVLRGKTRVILRSKIDAIKGLSRAWQRRKEIQAATRISTKELRKRMSRGFFTPYLNRNE